MAAITEYQLVCYLVDKGLINKRQHAFITNHSIAANLVECINDRIVSLKSSNHINVV